jgi:hypothetical protein
LAGGNGTVTLPNKPGSIWYFDITGVTLSSHQLVFKCTGGTSVVVTAAALQVGQSGVVIGIPASGVATRFS